MKEVKAIFSTWFEVKVSVYRTDENGTTRKVKELYSVNAFSFTEAEARTVAHIGDCGGEVVEEKIASYKEVLSILAKITRSVVQVLSRSYHQ